MQKTVNIKIKANLRSNIMIWNIDFHYSRDYYLSYNTFIKMQTQDLIMKKFKPKKFKHKDSNLIKKKTLILIYIKKPRKISYQNKNKEYFKKK